MAEDRFWSSGHLSHYVYAVNNLQIFNLCNTFFSFAHWYCNYIVIYGNFSHIVVHSGSLAYILQKLIQRWWLCRVMGGCNTVQLIIMY